MSQGYKAFYLLFCTGIVFAVWILGYGLGLQIFFRDGRILEATITTYPFAPLQQLWLYKSNTTLQMVAIWALVPALLAGGLVAFMGLRPQGSPLGHAAFQDIASLR
ncbi:MAG: type IV secretory system conjugative DNA transfer family protein, partial [Mesorhizobium sp.]